MQNREMPRKRNSVNQYEDPSKQFSDPTQPKKSKFFGNFFGTDQQTNRMIDEQTYRPTK